MKGIYTRERRGSTAVYITYTPPGKRRVRESVECVAEGPDYAKRIRAAEKRAEKVLIKRRAAIIDGTHGLVRLQSEITLKQFVEKFYAEELRERGIRTAEEEINRCTEGPLGRHFGDTRLVDLNEFRIRGYLKARREGKVPRLNKGGRKGVGPGALNRDLARLKNLWNAAKKRKLVSGDNPVSEVENLTEPEGRVRYLSPEEETALLEACGPDLRRIIETALHTGIRQGALLGLEWEHVDFKRGLIKVTRELDKAKKGYWVPLNRRVREVLHELPRHSEYVFAGRDGKKRRCIRTIVATALKRAGIKDFTFHDLRHTAASRIVQAGGTLLDAGEHLGHSSPIMTQRYAHLSQDRRQQTAELTISPDSVTHLSPARERRAARTA